MSRIAYRGSIQPAVWLSFKTIKVSGCHSSADDSFAYAVENESLFEFKLIARTPAGDIPLNRRARQGARLFNEALNTYITEPLPANNVNLIFDAYDAGSLNLFLTIKIWYKPFFYEMLKYLTRTSGDTHNLARPDSTTTIEGSFAHRRSGNRARITHPDVQREIKDIPCRLSGWDIRPSSRSGRPPTVKLYIYMLAKERLAAAARDETARTLVAADYSKIYRYGRSDRAHPWWEIESAGGRATGMERCLKTWEKNVAAYLFNHTSLTRGETIRQEIIQHAATNIARPQLQVVQTVRDDIDARLITANHWGDLREDWNTERYQRKLSDLFGAIHQSQWWASPVRFLRDFSDSWDYDTSAKLILQWGVGHCGEHATVSFSIIRGLMSAGHHAKFENVIYSGNANIDHAFVVGGIRVRNIIHTVYNHSFSPGNIGEAVDVWDLRDTLRVNPGKDGFVLDPYLAPTRQARTARALLAALNASRRGRKKTDFLYFGEQHPTAPAPTEESRPSVRGV